MSQLRVNEIVSENGTGAPSFPYGATGLSVSYADNAGIATYASTAGIATSADGLETARTIGLSGDATGSGSFDGTGDLTIAVDVNTSTYADTAGIATNAQGLSGAPDIAVGNIVAAAATFSGDVSIGGTITYQDVTDVNAVGVITATKGIDIRSNTLTDTTTFRYGYQYVDGDGDPRVESVSFDRVQTGPINSDNSPNTSLVTAGAVLNSTVASAQGLSGTPNITIGDASFNGLLDESVNITAGKVSDNLDIDLADGMVHYFTTAETTTSTPNIRVDGSTTLNSALSTGETVAITIITTAAAAGYSTALNIDGSAATLNWVGGSAPSAGGASGLDIYTHQIIKTGSAAFTVISSANNAA